MKEFLKLGLHCRVDRGATVGMVRWSGAALDLMLVSRPIQRNPGATAGTTIKEIEHRVADRGFGLQTRAVPQGCSAAARPTMTRCQRMARVERRASGDGSGGPGIFPIGGLSGREPSSVTCSRPGRFCANAAGGLSDIRSPDREAILQ